MMRTKEGSIENRTQDLLVENGIFSNFEKADSHC